MKQSLSGVRVPTERIISHSVPQKQKQQVRGNPHAERVNPTSDSCYQSIFPYLRMGERGLDLPFKEFSPYFSFPRMVLAGTEFPQQRHKYINKILIELQTCPHSVTKVWHDFDFDIC